MVNADNCRGRAARYLLGYCDIDDGMVGPLSWSRQRRHYPYEWLVKSGEGHGFYKQDNRQELYDKLLAFLARNIGARKMASPPPAVPSAADVPAATAAAPSSPANQ